MSEGKVISENAENLMEEVQCFLGRSATDKEAVVLFKKHCSQVFGQLFHHFDQFEKMIKVYPSYAATALIGLVKFDKQINATFQSIVDDESLLEVYTFKQIQDLGMIQVRQDARDLIKKLVQLDEKIAIAAFVLVWMVNNKFEL